MSGDTRSYVLDISQDLFYLTTESLRLHSNETKRYQTLASLVNSRAATSSYRDEHNPGTLRKHLCAVPTKGNIRIHLSISKTSAENLAEAKERLGERLGSEMTVGDTLSVLLFDYVAERRAARVLDKLGLDETRTNEGEPLARDTSSGNIFPIR